MASITDGTWKQYEKPIHLWWTFCQEKGISVYDPDSSEVIEFFSQQSKKVNTYSTINIYRSAISILMSNKLGKDPDISRLFRGISNIKPTKAKYTYTWDPNKVLDHLATWGPNESLSLEKLTKKVAMLLALSTAQRVQTLFSIKTQNVRVLEDRIKIIITDRTKTSRYQKEQPILDIPVFTERIDICPATALQEYLKKTSQFRPEGEERMFITFKKPFHAATAQSISRWIKKTMEVSGIDVSTFSGHSTRHASTSAAARRGVNIESIRKAAGWSRNSTVFANFYNRPLLEEDEFAEAIFKK